MECRISQSISKKMSMENENMKQSVAIETVLLTNNADCSSVNSIQETVVNSCSDNSAVPSKEAGVEEQLKPTCKVLFTRLNGTNYICREPSIKEILDGVTVPWVVLDNDKDGSEKSSGKVSKVRKKGLKPAKSEDKIPFNIFTLDVATSEVYSDLKEGHCPVNSAIIRACEKSEDISKISTIESSLETRCESCFLDGLILSPKNHSDYKSNDLPELQNSAEENSKRRKVNVTIPKPVPLRNFTNSISAIGPIRKKEKQNSEEPNSTPGVSSQEKLHLHSIKPYASDKRRHPKRKSSKKVSSRAAVRNGFPQERPEEHKNFQQAKCRSNSEQYRRAFFEGCDPTYPMKNANSRYPSDIQTRLQPKGDPTQNKLFVQQGSSAANCKTVSSSFMQGSLIHPIRSFVESVPESAKPPIHKVEGIVSGEISTANEIDLEAKKKVGSSQSPHMLKHRIPRSSICVPAEIPSSKESSSILERPLFANPSMTFEELARPIHYQVIFDLELVSWNRDIFCGH